MKYQLHTPTYEKIARDYRKTARLPKKYSPLKAFGQAFDLIKPYHNAMMIAVLANELNWHRQNRPVIFPESDRLIKRLLKSATEIEDPRGLVLPFETFMVAMPEGLVMDGVALKPSIIGCYDVAEVNDRLLPAMRKESGMEHKPTFNFQPEHYGHRVFYVVQHSSLGRPFVFLFLDKDVPAMMRAKNYREALAAGSFFTERSPDGVMVTPEELREQFFAMKLTCAIAIYHQATQQSCLVPGMPSATPPRQLVTGGAWQKNLTSLTLKEPPVEHASPEMHVRDWHFRQLRHERYYRGDYESYAPGTRWTFVRPALVGKGDPHTLKNDEDG